MGATLMAACQVNKRTRPVFLSLPLCQLVQSFNRGFCSLRRLLLVDSLSVRSSTIYWTCRD